MASYSYDREILIGNGSNIASIYGYLSIYEWPVSRVFAHTPIDQPVFP